jgi:hypothetical protein
MLVKKCLTDKSERKVRRWYNNIKMIRFCKVNYIFYVSKEIVMCRPLEEIL